MPVKRPSKAITRMFPSTMTTNIFVCAGKRKDHHHHTGMDKHERADAKERHGIAHIREDVFHKFKDILKEKVHHIFLGFAK